MIILFHYLKNKQKLYCYTGICDLITLFFIGGSWKYFTI